MTEVKGEVEVSGRELDAAVAERVMQWKRVHSDRDKGDDRKDIAWMLLKDRVLKGDPYTYPSMNGLHDRTFARWSPSSDIATAMEVVEKFLTDGTIVEMVFKQARWNVRFHWNAQTEFKAHAPELPEAICRAALQAVGEEEK